MKINMYMKMEKFESHQQDAVVEVAPPRCRFLAYSRRMGRTMGRRGERSGWKNRGTSSMLRLRVLATGGNMFLLSEAVSSAGEVFRRSGSSLFSSRGVDDCEDAACFASIETAATPVSDLEKLSDQKLQQLRDEVTKAATIATTAFKEAKEKLEKTSEKYDVELDELNQKIAQAYDKSREKKLEKREQILKEQQEEDAAVAEESNAEGELGQLKKDLSGAMAGILQEVAKQPCGKCVAAVGKGNKFLQTGEQESSNDRSGKNLPMEVRDEMITEIQANQRETARLEEDTKVLQKRLVRADQRFLTRQEALESKVSEAEAKAETGDPGLKTEADATTRMNKRRGRALAAAKKDKAKLEVRLKKMVAKLAAVKKANEACGC